MFLYIVFNIQKLLILFNKIGVIRSKTLIKPYIFLSFIDHSFEERRKILKGEQLEGSIINIKLI